MLTNSKITKSLRNATKEITLVDGPVGDGSLRLRIRPGARGTAAVWVAWWTNKSGAACTKAIGRYPDLSLADARTTAAKEIMRAKRPGALAAHPSERTIAKLFEGYVRSLEVRGKASAGDVKYRLSKAAKVLGDDTAAGDVTPGDIASVLRPIYQRGSPAMAGIVRSAISAAFNWGMRAEHDYRTEKTVSWMIDENPVLKIPADGGASNPRERNLTADELATLWVALGSRQHFSEAVSDAIRISVCTGQRILEIMRIEGSDLDLDAATWTMPARKTKTKKHKHTLPLPAQAVEIFRRRAAVYGRGLLLPAVAGRNPGGMMDYATPGAAIKAWLRDTKACAPFQARDLRRTWKSRAGDGAGIGLFERDLIQQHAKGSSAVSMAHYDHAEYLPQMRPAMAKWEAWLDANVVNPKPQPEAQAA